MFFLVSTFEMRTTKAETVTVPLIGRVEQVTLDNFAALKLVGDQIAKKRNEIQAEKSTVEYQLSENEAGGKQLALEKRKQDIQNILESSRANMRYLRGHPTFKQHSFKRYYPE